MLQSFFDSFQWYSENQGIVNGVVAIIGTFGTIVFGFFTFVLTKKANRLQDIAATVSSFPPKAFSACEILPLQMGAPVGNDAGLRLLDFYDLSEKNGWGNSDFIIVLNMSDQWPMHTNVKKVKKIIVTVSHCKYEFNPLYAFVNSGDEQLLLLSLSFCEKTNYFRKKGLDKKAIREFIMFPWDYLKEYQNAEIRILFEYENLFLRHSRPHKLELVLDVQNSEEIHKGKFGDSEKLIIRNRRVRKRKLIA